MLEEQVLEDAKRLATSCGISLNDITEIEKFCTENSGLSAAQVLIRLTRAIVREQQINNMSRSRVCKVPQERRKHCKHPAVRSHKLLGGEMLLCLICGEEEYSANSVTGQAETADYQSMKLERHLRNQHFSQ